MNITEYIRHLFSESFIIDAGGNFIQDGEGTLLVDVAVAGYSLEIGEDLYIALLPDAPDNAVVLYDKSGEAPTPDLCGNSIQYSDVLMLVRDLEYRQAFARLQQLDKAINLTRNKIYNHHTFILVHRVSDLVFNYFDENKRAVASATYRVYYTLN